MKSLAKNWRSAGLAAILLALPAAAKANASNEFKPQYELTVRDASQLYQLTRENAWMKEFFQSNLYRGLTLRVSPALTTVADAQTDNWKGRLVDFLVEKIAAKRPVTFAYFHRRGLANPIGVRLNGLSKVEQDLLAPVIRQFRPTKSVETEVERGEAGTAKVSVDPVRIQLQNFAVVLKDGCLSLARDPKVAAAMSLACPKADETLKTDAALTVDMKELAPSMYPFATRFAGLGAQARLDFDWDSSGKLYKAVRLEMPLEAKGLLRTDKLPESFLRALPADTHAVAAAVIPQPPNYSPGEMSGYLTSEAEALKARPNLPVAIAVVPAEKNVHSVLLLREKDATDERLMQLTALFDANDKQVLLRKLCDNELVALSNMEAALVRMEDACSRKSPNLTNQPSALKEQLTTKPAAAGLLLNTADIFTNALQIGWDSKENPPELQQTQSLLSQLPRLSFSGQPEADRLVMNGVQQ